MAPRQTTKARRGKGEGGIYHDVAHNRYEATIEAGTDPATGTRRRIKIRAKTKTEVLARMRAARAQVDQGSRPTPASLTVGRFLTSWLDVVDGRTGSANTRANYESVIRNHIVPGLGAIRLDRLTPENVDKVLAAKAKAGFSRSTIGRIRTILADALRHAERRGLVTRNAGALANLPKTEAPEARRSLTPAEVAKLLKAVEGERLEALIVVGLEIGLRPGEFLGLHWSDLDLEAEVPTLTVSGAIKRTAKAGGGYTLTRGAVKRSTAGRRTIALPEMSVEALRTHRSRQAAEREYAAEAWTDHGLVFPTEAGGPVDPNNLKRVVARIGSKAGIEEMVTYTLRHTCASLLIDAGVGIEAVADLLGDDPQTLLRHYRHKIRPVAGAALGVQALR